MRVAIVFSDYRSDLPSGEREVVRNECAALARAGVEGHLVSAATDVEQQDPLYPLRAAGRVATGLGGSPLDRILEIDPDVVHVHNLFPNFGTRWLAKLNLPLIVTLHNYRSICAEGSLFRAGSPCTLCPDGSRWSGMRHRCYRGSAAATLPLAIANRGGLHKNPLIERADRVLVPSDFHREMLIRYGLDPDRSLTSPNFVPDQVPEDPTPTVTERAGWVYVGRLDAGKGILELVESWPEGERLTVLGDGPLRDAIHRAAGPKIHVVGQQHRSAVDRSLRSAEGLIFPSRHFESQGLVYLEALRSGTPIVARVGNAVATAVSAERTGTCYGADGDIVDALRTIRADASALSARCFAMFSQQYSESVWRVRRRDEYTSVLATARSGSSPAGS